MRKAIVTVLVIISVFMLTGCGAPGKRDLKIVVPAGSRSEFVYSEELISPKESSITIYAGEGLGDTEVVLKPVEKKGEALYQPTYLTPGMPVKMEAQKGEWFQVGVSVQNPGNEDIVVYVTVKGIE